MCYARLAKSISRPGDAFLQNETEKCKQKKRIAKS